MQNNEIIKSVNEVNAKGKIIRTGRDARGYGSISMVIRGRNPALIRFVVDNLPSNIVVGDSVTVKGHVKAYSYYNEIRERWMNVQYFVADEIRKNETELKEKFGVEGHYFGESMFRAYFAGTVTNALDTRDPNWGKLTIKVPGVGVDQRPSYVTCSYYKSRRLPPFNYEREDEVCLVTSINTPQKELDGRTVNFENLIIEDIVKLGDAELSDLPKGANPKHTNSEIDPDTIATAFDEEEDADEKFEI